MQNTINILYIGVKCDGKHFTFIQYENVLTISYAATVGTADVGSGGIVFQEYNLILKLLQLQVL